MSGENAGRYVRKVITPVSAVDLATSEIFSSIEDAYTALRRVTEADPRFGAAWKLGGTTLATRRMFNVDKLYFGPLHAIEVLIEPERAPPYRLYELKGEAEIALRIAGSATDLLSKGGRPLANAPFEMLFDAWSVALELPSSPINNLLEAGVNALIADRCAAGALVLGPARPLTDGEISRWIGASLRITQNGKTIAEGGTDALVSPPTQCAHEFLLEAAAVGFMPKPGQWISTGGLTPCVTLTSGANVCVIYDHDPALRFVVEPYAE